MRQTSFFPPGRREHGGSLSLGKRRARRSLSTKQALHVTLRSELARGERSLLRHKSTILHTLRKASRLFNVRVYRAAICGNHLHALVRGRQRVDLQNFFRVFAGHSAQAILQQHPLPPGLRPAPTRQGCAKNQRRFWAYLIYSRIITWGREFRSVARYILQNQLEALNLIAYRARRPSEPPS
jgi:REP element-mobilizing transposase RayT